MNPDTASPGHRDNRQADDAREARRVLIASAVGTTIEFYDFTLYGLASVLVFAPQFFPSDDRLASELGALATLAAGYVVRPIGGIVAGHFGDRIGRKRMLVLSFMVMGTVTLLLAFLPSRSVIGLGAPIVLTLLRMLQGFAAGAEWGGAALMAVEHAPEHKRGLYGAAPSFGVSLGTLLAIAVLVVVSATAREAFVSYGWRIAFALSAVLIVLGYLARRQLTESPLFERALRNEPPRVPLLSVLRHPGALLRGVGWGMGASVFGLTISPFSVGYVVAATSVSREVVLACLGLGFAANIAVMLVVGRLLDRLPRRKVLVAIAMVQIPSVLLFFPLLGSGSLLAMAVAYTLGLGTLGAVNAAMGSMMADQFPVEVAYTGVSLSYNIAFGLGSLAPLVATTIVSTSGSIVGFVVVLVAATVAALAVSVTRPRRTIDAGTPRPDTVQVHG